MQKVSYVLCGKVCLSGISCEELRTMCDKKIIYTLFTKTRAAISTAACVVSVVFPDDRTLNVCMK